MRGLFFAVDVPSLSLHRTNAYIPCTYIDIRSRHCTFHFRKRSQNRPSYDRHPICFFLLLLFAGGPWANIEVTTNAQPADGVDYLFASDGYCFTIKSKYGIFRVNIPGSQGPQYVIPMLIVHVRRV